MNIRNIINPIIAKPPKANIPANITGPKPNNINIITISKKIVIALTISIKLDS